MVKFGKQFEFHQIPEWTEYYLDYNSLKILIKKYERIIKSKHKFKILRNENRAKSEYRRNL